MSKKIVHPERRDKVKWFHRSRKLKTSSCAPNKLNIVNWNDTMVWYARDPTLSPVHLSISTINLCLHSPCLFALTPKGWVSVSVFFFQPRSFNFIFIMAASTKYASTFTSSGPFMRQCVSSVVCQTLQQLSSGPDWKFSSLSSESGWVSECVWVLWANLFDDNLMIEPYLRFNGTETRSHRPIFTSNQHTNGKSSHNEVGVASFHLCFRKRLKLNDKVCSVYIRFGVWPIVESNLRSANLCNSTTDSNEKNTNKIKENSPVHDPISVSSRLLHYYCIAWAVQRWFISKLDCFRYVCYFSQIDDATRTRNGVSNARGQCWGAQWLEWICLNGHSIYQMPSPFFDSQEANQIHK